MKKYLLGLLFLSIFLTGCGSKTPTEYKGNVTDLSKHYLSKGYIVNMYRSMEALGDDNESYGKAYVTMGFQILTEYTSTYDYDADADYNIKKMTVTDVHVIKTAKMGFIEDEAILEQYSTSLADKHVDVKNRSSKYVFEYTTPHSSGVQQAIWIGLNKIALYDQNTSTAAAEYDNPTLAQVYSELGVTRNAVAFKIGFRVELLTVGGDVLYKDYVIEVPPVEANISDSSTYQYSYMETDTSKMEPFLEKE